jgi:hypothetical protein
MHATRVIRRHSSTPSHYTATPRWATLPASRPFHRGLYRRICASIYLRLWMSLAILSARHTLWSTRLASPALRISSRRSPTVPASFSARRSSTATSISRRGTTSIGWTRTTLPLPAGCRVRRGFFASVGGFRCVWWFSPAADLPGLLRCIGVWFWWLYYIPSVGSSVHNISGTLECSLHVGFDFCHSGNAIRCCARA